MEITILDGAVLNDNNQLVTAFSTLGKVHFYNRTDITNEKEIIERIGTSEAILTNKVPITESILQQVPQLKYVGVTATGYNIIDLAACKKHGVTVTNIPAYSTEAVAQFTFALLLEIASKVGLHNQLVKEGKWSGSPDFSFWASPLMELKGKTIGLLGFGAIGQEVAKIAEAFSMEVIFWNHRKKSAPESIHQVSLETLYEKSDIISLHLPQTPETEKIIDTKALEKMKSTAILINTARGGLVDEIALSKALKDQKIAAYGADVVSSEPIKKDNPLLSAPNCILTPHIAWAPLETRSRLIEIALNNLIGFISGDFQHVVS